MRLFQVGELKLLKEVRERFRLDPGEKGVIVGIGDDAAVIAPRHKKIIVTTDMMNEGVHFDLDYTSPFHLGFKLVSVNVSDIMAMGGVARYLFINLALTRDVDDDFFKKLYDGIEHALCLYGVQLLGGDLCSAMNDTVFSATVIGEGEKIITRAGASVGDKIYITSSTGDSALGLEILKRLDDEGRAKVKSAGTCWGTALSCQHNDRIQKTEGQGIEKLSVKTERGNISMSWKIAEPLLKRHLMPTARYSGDIAPYASSMLDVSDGLFIDLCRICDESGSGATVYREKIPISAESREASALLGLTPFHYVVSGGEDYELLFTSHDFPLDEYNRCHDINVSCIGEITREDRNIIDSSGGKTPLKSEGYQHFGPPG
ncbi:MAG: thiamine-phosphate kinase [Dissulfurispiraceae bacterium]|jgi:thiamine-monophosphate kinase